MLRPSDVRRWFSRSKTETVQRPGSSPRPRSSQSRSLCRSRRKNPRHRSSGSMPDLGSRTHRSDVDAPGFRLEVRGGPPTDVEDSWAIGRSTGSAPVGAPHLEGDTSASEGVSRTGPRASEGRPPSPGEGVEWCRDQVARLDDPGARATRRPAGDPREVVDGPTRRIALALEGPSQGPGGSGHGGQLGGSRVGFGGEACWIRSDRPKVRWPRRGAPGCSSKIRPISKTDLRGLRRRSTEIGSSMARVSNHWAGPSEVARAPRDPVEQRSPDREISDGARSDAAPG